VTLSIQLQNVKAYIKKKIAEVDPNVDTRDNSGVGDLLIKPLEAILQPIADELIRIDTNQSLVNAPTMTETDLDELIANIFLTRNPGAKAKGTVRIFFSDPVTVTIPAASEFTSGDGVRFFSLAEVTITANQMSVNRDGDFFYVETLVEAEEVGTDGNVAEGAIVDFVGGPSNLLKVENIDPFVGGADKESNTDLVERAKDAITVRDLVSKPAIKTVLREKFLFIKDIRVIGFGDPEMERDFLVGDNMVLGLFPPVDEIGSTPGIHIGGKVDIYIRVVALSNETVQIDNLQQNVILRPKDEFDPLVDPPATQYVSLIKRPIIDLVTLQEVDSVTGEPIGTPLVKGIDFDFIVDNPTVRFSTQDRTRLFINNGTVLGGTFILTTRHSTEVVEVQEFVENDDNRVVTADLLVKFTQPAFIDFSISYRLLAESETTVEEMEALIFDFINNLGVGAKLEASDLVQLIYDNGGEFVELPFTMTATVLNNDGTETVIVSDNVIEIPTTAAYLPRTIVLTEL